MKLIHTATNNEVKEGDSVTTFRGEIGTLTTLRPNEGANGKVYVSFPNECWSREFYPTVIGCEFVGYREQNERRSSLLQSLWKQKV